VHHFGFIIRMYHDALSSQCKKKNILSTSESTPCYKYSPTKVLKNNLAGYNCHDITLWEDQYNSLFNWCQPTKFG